VKRLPGAFAGHAMPARYGMLAFRWRKEAVIEVRACQTTIAILPPRGYFPQDFSPVEPRRLHDHAAGARRGDRSRQGEPAWGSPPENVARSCWAERPRRPRSICTRRS